MIIPDRYSMYQIVVQPMMSHSGSCCRVGIVSPKNGETASILDTEGIRTLIAQLQKCLPKEE